MTPEMKRAQSIWLVSFGDVVTLLITFFIMMIAMNKVDVSKLQKWATQQMTVSYTQIEAQMKEQQIEGVKIALEPQGIRLTLEADEAFVSGSYEPTEKIIETVSKLSKVFSNTRVLQLADDENNRVIQLAKERGEVWNAQVVVEGHTDNDPINPNSRLRNNWILSTLRAQAIMKIIAENSGLTGSSLTIAGFGEFQPIAENSTSENKAKNRRVDILISASFEKESSG